VYGLSVSFLDDGMSLLNKLNKMVFDAANC